MGHLPNDYRCISPTLLDNFTPPSYDTDCQENTQIITILLASSPLQRQTSRQIKFGGSANYLSIHANRCPEGQTYAFCNRNHPN